MGNREYIPYPRWGMDLVETLCIICSLLQGQISTVGVAKVNVFNVVQHTIRIYAKFPVRWTSRLLICSAVPLYSRTVLLRAQTAAVSLQSAQDRLPKTR